MLMSRIELDALAIGENARPARERDVVKMNHVKTARKNSANATPVDQWPSQLLGGEAGQSGRAAAQAVQNKALGFGEGFRLHAAAQQVVGISVVNDFDLVAAPHEGMGKATHIMSITTEITWWVEGCDHRDAQRPSQGDGRRYLPMKNLLRHDPRHKT
jgi:hypothetical protein